MREFVMLILCSASIVALAMQMAANVALCRTGGIPEEEAEDER